VTGRGSPSPSEVEEWKDAMRWPSQSKHSTKEAANETIRRLACRYDVFLHDLLASAEQNVVPESKRRHRRLFQP
jgi:hypothetical protein